MPESYLRQAYNASKIVRRHVKRCGKKKIRRQKEHVRNAFCLHKSGISSKILRVKLTQLRLYAIKLALYGGGLLYLAGDLFWWQGPLWSTLHQESEEAQQQIRNTAIEVYGEKISHNGLQRFTAEQACIYGQQPANITKRARNTLITDLLIRLKTRYNDSSVPDFAQEATAAVTEAESRAASPEAFAQQLQTHGYTKNTFTQMLAVIMREQYYLQETLKEHYTVSDTEAATLAAYLADRLVMPTHRHVRHIFLATADKDTNTIQQQAEQLLKQLQACNSPETLIATFTELAAQYSQDPRTAQTGGDLGDIYVYPTPPLPELHLFGPEAIPAHRPGILRSPWGIHIILAGEIIPPRPLTREEYEPSLRTAIESYKRAEALNSWIKLNTAEAHHKNKIRYHEQ